jgi:hypothetical protein
MCHHGEIGAGGTVFGGDGTVSKATTPRAQSPSAIPVPPARRPFDLNREILAAPLTPAAKVLLLVIADHAGHGRSKCTASTGTLAREAGISDRYVRELLPVLESAGWIQVERATGSRQSRHTIWLAPRGDSPPFLKLHEVGTPSACSRNSDVHEVGTMVPTNGSSTAPENVSRFAPIAQNWNPPSPPPPADDDPAETARAIDRLRALVRGPRPVV